MSRSYTLALKRLAILLALLWSNLATAQLAIIDRFSSSPVRAGVFYLVMPPDPEGWGQENLYLCADTIVRARIEYPEGTEHFILSTNHVNVIRDRLPSITGVDSTVHTVKLTADAAEVSVVGNVGYYELNEGCHFLPTSKWGREYILCGARTTQYRALQQPSCFVITACENNTQVTITPTVGLVAHAADTTIGFPAGQSFTRTLQEGESILYKTARSSVPIDISGTQVHASRPIQVITSVGDATGSGDFTGPHFAMEAMTPMESWGTRYYTAPLTTSVLGCSFEVIASRAGQTITKRDSAGVSHIITVPGQLTFGYVDQVSSPSSWSSEYPFYLVQNGDNVDRSEKQPDVMQFMAVIPAVDRAAKRVVLAVPKDDPSLQQYYVNDLTVTARTGAWITMNGQPLNGVPILSDSLYTLCRVHLTTGGAYWFASSENLAVTLFEASQSSKSVFASSSCFPERANLDTVPPSVYSTRINSISGLLTVLDSGKNTSHFYTMKLDSMVNMTIDSIRVIRPTVLGDSVLANIRVKDSSVVASGRVTVLDSAQNATTVRLHYTPSPLTIEEIFFGQVILGDSATLPAQLVNTYDEAVTVYAIYNSNNSIHAAVTASFPIVLSAGQSVQVPITFAPKEHAWIDSRMIIPNDQHLPAHGYLSGDGILSEDTASAAVGEQTAIVYRAVTVHEGSLKVEITDATDVSLEVCDLVGRPILQMSRHTLAPGPHVFDLGRAGVARGNYLYRCVLGGRVFTGRIAAGD